MVCKLTCSERKRVFPPAKRGSLGLAALKSQERCPGAGPRCSSHPAALRGTETPGVLAGDTAVLQTGLF